MIVTVSIALQQTQNERSDKLIKIDGQVMRIDEHEDKEEVCSLPAGKVNFKMILS